LVDVLVDDGFPACGFCDFKLSVGAAAFCSPASGGFPGTLFSVGLESGSALLGGGVGTDMSDGVGSAEVGSTGAGRSFMMD
jgi:hypothetical protein